MLLNIPLARIKLSGSQKHKKAEQRGNVMSLNACMWENIASVVSAIVGSIYNEKTEILLPH